MSYESPINLVMGQINTSIEGEIFKAVQRVGVNVDKEELIKALRHDRNQYQKGYDDRDMEIVRCGDCKRRGTYDCPVYVGGDGMYSEPDDWFCADGERKECR